uniref:DNA 5'-3' helicase n=1 Tax=Riptortus pedestris TaxID=329032 RepID=R4WDF6_RIPPE|nr:pom1 [Riptortus pedestris]
MYGNETVGYKTLKSDCSEESFPFKGAKGIVINSRQKKSALIVAKLLDFLALVSEPLEHDIICLPHGQQNLPQELLPLLEQYDNLILWFDNDSVSWGNAKMFTKKLSEGRCSLIRPLENQPAPYICLKNGYNIPTIVKSAQPVSHASIVTFANLREDVLTELYNSDKVSGVKWERFPALNGILKGHRRGELSILTGPTGSGKTTFMSEYSLDLACSSVTTLWGSFEIRNQRLAKTMMTQMFCAPLEKNLNKFNEWADKFERLPIYFMTFHGQQPLNTVMEAVEHATYVHDVAHVIIDNVQFMLGISSSEAGFLDRFSRQDALIASFRNFATTCNCHVTLVIHPRKERDGEQLTPNSIFGGAKAAQEADNVLIIQHKMSHASLKLRKYLQVAKNRFSGDLGIMPLEFDKEALSFRTKQK